MKFEDGTLVKGAYVVIDGVEIEVHMPEYSGNTPVSAENLNKMQQDLLKILLPIREQIHNRICRYKSKYNIRFWNMGKI